MHCIVTSMLLCSFSSSSIVSYLFFPSGLFYNSFVIRDICLYHLFQSECCFDHFVLSGLFFQRASFQLPVVSVDLVLQ